MAAENLHKKTTGATSLTDVTLASMDDNGPSNKEVLFACNMCDKSYDKKSSFQSHMRTKHRAAKETDVEKGTRTTQKRKGPMFYQWSENEKDKNLQRTREIDSFLANKSDNILAEAAMEAEEAEAQIENILEVRNHELEWFEEDNMTDFNQEFTSDFASSLRRQSVGLSQPQNKLAELHNEMMKKQIEKYDAMVVRTTRMLNTAEEAKKDLRKWKKSLEKELAETQENWQGTSEADSEEISGLKATVTAQKIRIDELELLAAAPGVENNKCEKCYPVPNSGEMTRPMKEGHGDKNKRKCKHCPEVFVNVKLWTKHMKKHQTEWNFKCEVCKLTFSSLRDARAHSLKPCGNIKQKDVVIDIEEEESHRCNACATSYNSNKELEEHMDENHMVDCSKCNTTFKSQDEVYAHANKCSEVLEPLICDKCNIELISKAGLKKHMGRCKGDERPVKKSQEECWNGSQCKFRKQNRCSYFHPEQPRSEEPWQTAQRRRQPRPAQVLHCNICEEKFQSREEKQNHKCQHVTTRRQDRIEPSTRRKDIECFRGPNCFRLANDTCWFKHSSVRNSSPHRGHEKASNTTLWCKYQDKCTNSSCTYKHFGQGFQKTQSRKRS